MFCHREILLVLITIQQNEKSTQRNIVKFQLSHIQDEVLFSTPDLKHYLTPSTTSGAHCTWPTPLHGGQGYRGSQIVSTLHNIGRYVVLHQQLGAIPFGTMCHSSQPMVPSMVSITFSTGLMKTCCLSWRKLVFTCKIFCYSEH